MLSRQSALAAAARLAVVVGALWFGGACRAGGDPEADLTVFAAASLSEAFAELGREFEAAHPGARVKFNFGASSALALQINEGAPADVFAPADAAQMQAAVASGRLGTTAVLAKNLLVVVVPVDGSVSAFEDLANPGVRLVLAAPEVPAGRYAREVLARASQSGDISDDFADRVLANLRSDEANVRGVLTKVQLGEADAGFVYQTDAPADSSIVRVVDIPASYNVVAEYLIAAVGDGGLPSPVAYAFVAFALSEAGQAVLQRHGFAGP